MRILIVEDNDILASPLRKAFMACDYEVDVAFTVCAATTAITKTGYDVAVFAHHLSDGSGDDLLGVFSRERPDCVCIMMTSDPNPELAMKWIKQGASAYLREPFDPEYLVEISTRAHRENLLLRVKDLLEVRTRELREKDELLSSSQRLARVGGWEWNVVKQTMVWTDEVYRIHDFEPDEFKPGDPKHISHSLMCYAPEYRPLVAAAFQRCVEQGEPYDLQCPFTTAKGHNIWIRTTAQPVFEEGHVVRVIGNLMDITESKQIEQALRESEEKHRNVFENAGDVIFIHDEKGRILAANHPAVERLGHSHAELMTMTVGQIDSPEERLYAQERTQRLMEWGHLSFETVHQCKDGSFIPTEVSAQRIVWDGQPVVMSICRDITKRKQAEAALEEESKFRRTLFQQSPDGMLIIDPQTTRFIDFNTAAHQQLGYSREEFAELSIFDIEAKENEDETKAQIAGVIKNGKGDFDTLQRTREGELRNVHVTAQFIDVQGRPVYFCVWRDITERIRMEEALRASKANLQTLFNAIHESVCLLTRDGRVLTCNETFASRTGRSVDKCNGQSIYDLIPADVGARRKEIVEKVVQMGQEVEFEDERMGCSFHHTVYPVFGSGRSVERLAIYAQDITEHKRAEEHMALMSRMLDDAPASITIHATDGRFLYVNQKTFVWHGYEKEEFMSINLNDLVKTESEKLIQERLRLIVEVGEATFEVVHLRKDGSTFPLQVLAKLVQWQGQPAILSIASDITDLKKAEEALRRTTELLDSVREAQSLYIEQGDPKAVFDALLQTIIRLTESEFGFLDEVVHDSDGGIKKRNLARASFPLNPESGIYDELTQARSLEQFDLNNLAGLPEILKEPVIANDYSCNPDICRFPPGCSPINAFMGLPVCSGGGVVGVVGVAKRDGGYDPEMAKFLEPYLNACAGIIEAVRLRTREREAVVALNESEMQVRKKLDAVLQPEGDISQLSLADIIPTATIQMLMDDLYRLTGFANALVDQNGKVLVATGWQDICTRFHRVNPETCRYCQESDTQLTVGVKPGTFNLYKCKNNMWDVSTPIMIGAEHVGNVFLGQFFFDDEKPDYEQFRAQARKYGFNEDEYLSALDRVPRLNREAVDCAIKFYSRFTALVSTLSYGNLKLARTLEEQKQAEEERVKLQQQLTQAQKMESVGRLAGGVAHDFNNMLSVILGHAEMASLQVTPDQPLYSDLQEIRKAADRSSNLTRQLLAFARKQTILPKVLDLNETVAGMLKMLQRLIGEDIQLNWQPDMALWPIKVDPSQIDQILANLCVNARDAIQSIGEITIETRNRVLDVEFCDDHPGYLPGEYVLLAISDNGCGMDKEILDKLFEPFFTTKGLGKGTGLGLATVYGIVKQNNGFIIVSSEPGQGTAFSIYMPRYQGKSEQLVTGRTSELTRNHHETILLVEDEPAILKMAANMLESLGFTVFAAPSPSEAFSLAADYNGVIHLLITDVIMPEMTGRDLAQSLQALYPSIKCLFMSGYTADVIAHHGVLDEGVHFLHKPFSLDQLITKVNEVLEGKHHSPAD